MQAVKALKTTSKRVVEVLPQALQICQGRQKLQGQRMQQSRQILGACLRTGPMMRTAMVICICRAWMTAHPQDPLAILQVGNAQVIRAQAAQGRAG